MRTVSFLFALPLLNRPAYAEIYKFDRLPAPGPRTLQSIYAFHAYARDIHPNATTHEQQIGTGISTVVRFDASFFWDPVDSPQPKVPIQDYNAIQLSLVRHEDWGAIDPVRFCCQAFDVAQKRCPVKDQFVIDDGTWVQTQTLHARSASEAEKEAESRRQELPTTGIYILIATNCGELKGATMIGSVSVRSSYGYLPGDEYAKVTMYYWLVPVYFVFALFWARSIGWKWSSAEFMERGIAFFFVTGIARVMCALIYYQRWNESGSPDQQLLLLFMAASTLASFLAYALLISTAFSGGVSKAVIDFKAACLIIAVACILVTLDAARDGVFLFVREQPTTPLVIVVLCLIPLVTPGGLGVSGYIGYNMVRSTYTLESMQQFDAAGRFRRSQVLLAISYLVGAAAIIYQVALPTNSPAIWQHRWLFGDMTTTALELMIGLALIHIWAPGTGSLQEVRVKDDEDGAGVSRAGRRGFAPGFAFVGASAILALVLVGIAGSAFTGQAPQAIGAASLSNVAGADKALPALSQPPQAVAAQKPEPTREERIQASREATRKAEETRVQNLLKEQQAAQAAQQQQQQQQAFQQQQQQQQQQAPQAAQAAQQQQQQQQQAFQQWQQQQQQASQGQAPSQQQQQQGQQAFQQWRQQEQASQGRAPSQQQQQQAAQAFQQQQQQQQAYQQQQQQKR